MKQCCYVVRYGQNESRLFLQKMAMSALSLVWGYLKNSAEFVDGSARSVGLVVNSVSD